MERYADELRTELLDGTIIFMSPRPSVAHNIVINNITRIFGNYLTGKTCISFSDGIDVYLTKKDRVIPDAMIICNREIIKANGVYGAPNLIVEVLSPSTAKNDRGYKKDLYEKCGVSEYWIVDTSNKSIEVYLLKDGAYQLDNIYTIYPDYLLEKMTDEEKSQIITEFKISLYNDMTVILDDIFENIYP